jgi:predicted DCC family thiol-disulfide oxidoreductase YuxK
LQKVIMPSPVPIFVYDGDCAFCTTCARFIERRIPTRARVVPWQFADLPQLGLTVKQCEAAVQWVDADGIAAGPDAIARLLRDAGRLWKFAGVTLGVSPVRAAAWPMYRWVADHRHLMPGGTASCALPQALRAAPEGKSA